MSETIIVQRAAPHYRIPLFRALYERFGWTTVVASNFPTGTFLQIPDSETPYIKRFPYKFDKGLPNEAYRCYIPFGAIAKELNSKRIISEFSMLTNASYTLPLLRHQKIIHTFALWSHGWNMERGFDTLSDQIRQHARLVPMSLADLLLTYSQEGKDWIDHWLPWKKTICIGNTIDDSVIRDCKQNVAGLRTGFPQLLSVGRLTEDKHFDRLLRIFRLVKNELPSASLTIIGDGPERYKLQHIIKSEIISDVYLAGSIYDEKDLAPYFVGSDLFILPGAAGLSVNHALAYGLPIVAYARGKGLPYHHPEFEYIVPDETGILCYENSEAAMAKIIVDTVVNSSYKSIRAKIPQFFEQNLRITSMLDQFAVVNQLL